MMGIQTVGLAGIGDPKLGGDKRCQAGDADRGRRQQAESSLSGRKSVLCHERPPHVRVFVDVSGCPKPNTPVVGLNRKASERGNHLDSELGSRQSAPMLDNRKEKLIALIQSDPSLIEALHAVCDLDLPDCWITAGAIRNRVWDHLHGFAEPTPLNDVDVIYLDPNNLDEAFEKQQDQALGKRLPGLPWSVKNQARMAKRNGDPPYRSIDDALLHWCEMPTAVATRLKAQDEVEVAAPLGLDDLFDLIVRPTPFALQHPHKLAQ
jgi:hypothetical protein